MDRHITLLGIIYIASGILGLFIALLVFWVIAGATMFSGDVDAFLITSTIGGLIAGFIGILAIPEIIAGIGLLKRQEWARILALILGVLSLIEIPIGTAVGIYTLWALLKQDTVALFNPRMRQATS